MFRGLRERRGDRPAVGPEWEGGAAATRRFGASSEKNQEQKISRDTRGGTTARTVQHGGTDWTGVSRATQTSGLD